MGFLTFVFEWPRRRRAARGSGREAAVTAAAISGAQGVDAFQIKRGARRGESLPVCSFSLYESADLATLPLGGAEAWRRQGALYARAGYLMEAVDCYEKSLALTRSPGDREAKGERADTLTRLGAAYQARNDFSRAEARFFGALEIYQKLGRQSGVARAAASLGELFVARGAWDRAEFWYGKALGVDEARSYKAGMAMCHGCMGEIHLLRSGAGEAGLRRAEASLQKALRLYETLGLSEGVASSCGNLGVVYGAGGDLSRAEAMFRRSLALEEALDGKNRDNAENIALDWGNLGVVLFARGRLASAENMQRRALHHALRADGLEAQATAYDNLASVCFAKGDAAEAVVCLRAARELFNQIGLFARSCAVEARLCEIEPLAGRAVDRLATPERH